MKLDPDPTDKNFVRIISTQQSIISGALGMAARIDEARLKRTQKNGFDDILEQIRAEEARAAH